PKGGGASDVARVVPGHAHDRPGRARARLNQSLRPLQREWRVFEVDPQPVETDVHEQLGPLGRAERDEWADEPVAPTNMRAKVGHGEKSTKASNERRMTRAAKRDAWSEGDADHRGT